MLVMDIPDQCLRPNADNFWDLGNVLYAFGTLYITNISCLRGSGACGSSSYPFGSAYIKKIFLGNDCYLTADGASLCINGKALGDESISRLYVGDSSVYYAEMNSSYAFVPSSTTYDFALGSSSYPWKKAYITELYLNGTKFSPTTVDTSKIAYSSTVYASMNSSKQFIPSAGTGYDLGNSTYPWQYAYVTNLYINGTAFNPASISVSKIAYSSSVYAELNASKQFVPYASTGYSLGSSTYPWANAYVTNLYINGTKFEASSGGSFAGSQVTMGGSTSYYIICNTSRELRPNTTSTYYPFYLGSASYYWHYAYIGSNTVKIGSTASSKLAFFAGTPIARQTLSTTSNNMSYTSATSSNYLYVLNNLVGILKNKYGLIA